MTTQSTKSASSLRLVVAQANLLVGAIAENIDRIVALAGQARDEFNADAVVFPELALTGYPPEDLLLRPGLYERVAEGLTRLRHAVKGIDVILGYPEHTPQGVYNAALVLRDGEIIASARKHYLPNYSVFDEKRYFIPGHGPCVVDIGGVPVGITLCEDIWYPDPVAAQVKAGAQLIVTLNASPYHLYKSGEREHVVTDRVKENRVPIMYANLVGGQDELIFDGDSFVMDMEG